MKDDLPYFSHDNDSRNHPKMKALRARYVWTGYGQFWALNEMIAGSDLAYLFEVTFLRIWRKVILTRILHRNKRNVMVQY